MNWKTPRGLTLTLFLVFPPLAACGGFGAVGGLTAGRLPTNVERPCERPETYLGAGDWEIIAGRIGDELITCSAEKQVAVEAYNQVAGVIE